MTSEVAATLKASGKGGGRTNDHEQTMVVQSLSLRGREGGATAELGGDLSPALRAASGGGSKQYVALAENQRGELRETDTSPALSRGGGKPGSGYSAVRNGTKIRRLTPTERERLMGAPDGWTYPDGPSLADAPMGLPAENACAVDYPPDGRREAATGDGVAVPCSEWLGRRLLTEDTA